MTRDCIRTFATAVMLTAPAMLLAAPPVSAQSLAAPRSWTVTPFLSTSIGIGEPAPDDSIGLGAALGYDWTANLGFEGEIGHLFDIAGANADVDWSITNFSANGVYHFDVPRVTPYATFGLGVERSRFVLKRGDPVAQVFDPSATEVCVNFGGGVKYALDERFVARVDLRRFQANDFAPDYWRLYAGIMYNFRR